MNAVLDARIDSLIGKLDLSQKVRLVTGATFSSTYSEPAIGLRAVVLSDGPSGVRGVVWDDGDPSACLPSPTAIAASWDTELAGRIGRLLAAEAIRKGVDVVLAPTVNLHRSPLGGRHFECWSEDPWLTGAMAGELVRGLQDCGVAATAKHYVANDAETERFDVDIRVDERTLREVYLAPFEHLVRHARVWMVMAAYNSVNGVTMTEHDFLTAPLRTEWGFDGAVVSDWRATRTTVAAGRAGLDLAMPGPGGPWGLALEEAVRAGAVDEFDVDAKVRNLLRLAARVGALADVEVADGAGVPSADVPSARVAAEVRHAAAEGMVLLRNEGAFLPLQPAALRRVAVIGELAAHPRIQGGGSAQVRPPRLTTPLTGLQAALGSDVEVDHVDGYHLADELHEVPSSLLNAPGGAPPVTVRWFRDDGTLLFEEARGSSRLIRFGSEVPADAVTVTMSAELVPDHAGTWDVGFVGAGVSTFSLDGQVLSEGEFLPDPDGPGARVLTPPSQHHLLSLEAGQPVRLLLRHEVSGLGVSLAFGVRSPRLSPEEELDAGGEGARRGDVAVVVVGTIELVERDGYDRSDLRLPGNQDDVVRRVAAENPRTVVVVNSGAPVELPWRDDVSAIVLGWFGGQEMGNAVADVLLGAVEPGGRLPTTWPDRLASTPVSDTTPKDGRLDYTEGLHIGYRAWLRDGAEPAYPFGFGLGYTTWELLDVGVPTEAEADGDGAAAAAAAAVTVNVRNTGQRPGKHVIQIYLARPSSTVERPVRWLAGFAAVRAAAGETATAEIALPRRAFEHWDTEHRRWAAEPGRFDILVGFSATDIQHTTSVDVREHAWADT
jgi:beta-glucosidase